MINVIEGQMCAMSGCCESIAARNWSLEQELHPQISQEKTTFLVSGQVYFKTEKVVYVKSTKIL